MNTRHSNIYYVVDVRPCDEVEGNFIIKYKLLGEKNWLYCYTSIPTPLGNVVAGHWYDRGRLIEEGTAEFAELCAFLLNP